MDLRPAPRRRDPKRWAGIPRLWGIDRRGYAGSARDGGAAPGRQGGPRPRPRDGPHVLRRGGKGRVPERPADPRAEALRSPRHRVRRVLGGEGPRGLAPRRKRGPPGPEPRGRLPGSLPRREGGDGPLLPP